MNWSKNLYAFMLGIIIVFSGCFGTGTTDGEGEQTGEQTGDTVNTTVINYYNNTTVENNHYNNTTVDEPEWFSQGGVADLEYNAYFDDHESNNMSSYDITECVNLGGSPEIGSVGLIGMGYTMMCDIHLTTITTQIGQMLVIHEWTAFSLNTTCDDGNDREILHWNGGPSSLTNYGEWRVPGHAMNCTHDIFINDVIPADYSHGSQSGSELWSVAYSFRAVTVV